MLRVIKRPALWFGLVLLLLVLGPAISTYAKEADLLLRLAIIALVLGLSVLTLWSKWRHRRDEPSKGSRAPHDWADKSLVSITRWFHGGDS